MLHRSSTGGGTRRGCCRHPVFFKCIFNQSSSITARSLCSDLCNLSPSLIGPACFHWPISVNRLYVLRDPGGPDWHWDCGHSLPVILLFALPNPPSAVNNSADHSKYLPPLFDLLSQFCPLQSSGHRGKICSWKEYVGIYLKMSGAMTAVSIVPEWKLL